MLRQSVHMLQDVQHVHILHMLSRMCEKTSARAWMCCQWGCVASLRQRYSRRLAASLAMNTVPGVMTLLSQLGMGGMKAPGTSAATSRRTCARPWGGINAPLSHCRPCAVRAHGLLSAWAEMPMGRGCSWAEKPRETGAARLLVVCMLHAGLTLMPLQDAVYLASVSYKRGTSSRQGHSMACTLRSP